MTPARDDAARSWPYPLGVTLRPDGRANVAVHSATADAIEVCIFTAEDERRVTLTEQTAHVFHGLVEGMSVGTTYGLRVHGPWDPTAGLRHNPNKVLLDPYALAITGHPDSGQAVFGHDMSDPQLMDETDGAGKVSLSVVIERDFDWGDDQPPRTPLADTVVYEVHVKGFTKLHPDIPEELRGSYAAMGHPAAIKHLTDLGVTAVELLPVHQFVQDDHLADQGLRNYWGYNSIGFFAPHNEYSASGDTGGQVAEFKAMVKALHAAGIEVFLDVVYNHTAEGNDQGPTYSFKGLDNSGYYRLVDDDEAHYFDTTGTGNSLNVGQPVALRLIMDSLRYWVSEMHVDGFRFDLATTLTRQDGDAAHHSAFTDLIAQDPLLAPVKMIAEPWDTAGYQVGGFPADWSEWNGKFRDDVRAFWGADDCALGTLAQRMLGSPDVYESGRRSPLSSINFLTAHDGFTLADLTSYDEKHNDANGENNEDGESENRSSNHGAEGPTDDSDVNQRRARSRRNLMATLLLSAGVPMLLGGDELGRTQGGNNNAYCQDNEISWFDWAAVDQDLLAFTTELIAVRRAHPALRPAQFRRAPADDARDWVEILRSDGVAFEESDWDDAAARSILFIFGHEGADSFALLLNAADNGVEFAVPPAPAAEWQLVSSSDDQQRVEAPVDTLIVEGMSFTLLRSALT